MTLVSGTIPNLINGVSQQPQTVRNPSQATAQVNAMSTASRGLRKRPGSMLVALSGQGLPENPLADQYAAHAYKRTEDEQYHVLVYGPTGAVRVTNLVTGTVSQASAPYLVTDNARRDIKFLTVADSTFILNTGRTVAASPLPSAPLLDAQRNTTPNRSDLYIVVAQGNYGRTYDALVAFNGGGVIDGTYTTPNGGDPADATAISPDNIAEQLRLSLQTSLNLVSRPGVTLTRYSNVLHLEVLGTASEQNAVLSFRTRDGFNGQAMYAFNQIIDDFSKLPVYASRRSSPVKVVEGASKDNLGYYVRFEGGAPGNNGQWRECESLYNDPAAGHNLPGPTTQRLSAGLDATTMPVVLRNVAPNVFSLGTIAFGQRKAGDSVSNKLPSFVGKKITGMTFHRNRLAFLSESSVSMSEADNFFNFFNTTVIQVLDSDRIDVSANTTVVDDFHSAVAFDRDLFVFGARTQYRLSGDPLLTPKTVELKLVTSYENDPQLTPRAVGARILFGNTRGVYSQFRELYLTNDTVLEAPSITATVPEYIPGNARWMAASTTDDMLVVCPKEADALFVHSFYFSGNEKLMSSWSRWEFTRSDDSFIHVIHAEFLGSKLVITTVNSVVSVSTLDLSLGDRGDLGAFGTSHQDFAVDYPKELLSVGPEGTFFPAVGLTFTTRARAVLMSKTLERAGQEVPVVFDAPNQRYILPDGDYTDYDFVRVGRDFSMQYEFSEIYFRRPAAGGSQVTDTLSRLSLRRMEVVYENSASFLSQVTPVGRPTNTAKFPQAAEVTNAEYAGEYPYMPKDGVYRFYINTKNTGTRILLKDNSPHPVNFLSATWEAQYVRHSKAV